MSRIPWLCLLVACSAPAKAPPHAAPPPPPPEPAVVAPAPPPPPDPTIARIDDVVETHHGITVHDPYRWMEAGGTAYEAFLDAQNARARAAFAAIPGRNALRDSIHTANRGTTRVAVVAVTGPTKTPRVFLRKRAPDEEVWQLYVRDGWAGADRLLVDPRTRDKDGVHHALDNVAPAPDGKHVAYGIAASGSEDSTIEILDVEKGVVLPERIERAQYAAISWRDGSSFFYWQRRKPAPGDKKADWFIHSACYLHALGDDPERAQPVFGSAMPELGIAAEDFTWVQATSVSPWIIAGASPGTSADGEYFVAAKSAVVPGKPIAWRRISGPTDRVDDAFARGDTIYVSTYAGSPNRKIVAFDARTGTLAKAKVFVPELPNGVIDGTQSATDALYVKYIVGGPSTVKRFAWGTGKALGEVTLKQRGAIGIEGSSDERAGLVFYSQSWTAPYAYYEYLPASGVRDLKLVAPWPIDYSDLVTTETTARSADGTEVPISIVTPPSAPRDGSLPALLEGYAAYGVSQRPEFWPVALAWVKRGGVYAECHGRGGGELGKQWQFGGTKHAKENGVDDFLACERYLVEQHYTSSAHLTVTGTSAGGELVGGAITKRPELAAVAILRVPMVNVIRFETTEGGAANVPELGSVDNADDFKALLASDPYHRITKGARYPAIVLTGGRHDVRVPNWLPAKFAARIQAATTSGKPVLLRIEADAGHGIGSSRTQVEEEWADLLAFALAHGG